MNSKPSPEVEAVFASYPPNTQKKLRQIRRLVFKTAAAIEGVGPVTETLKWGEPAYLTEKSKSGSTIRMGWKKSSPSQYAIYFNCQTSLIDTCRTLFPELTFEGNRAIVFDVSDPLPVESVARCLELALTYHLTKRKQTARKRPTRRAAH